MADAQAKVNVFFTAGGGISATGWTETFWTNVSAGFANLTNIVNAYMAPRAALLGFGARIFGFRMSNIPPNRVTYVFFPTGTQGQPTLYTPTSAFNDYEPTQADLLYRVTDSAGKRRQFWLGGLPSGVIDTVLAGGINAAFTNSPGVKAWQQAILNASLGIRSKATAGPPPTYQFNLITNFLPIMMRNRKRGRPFEQFRGRRLA
jgi:hypothetical protein